MLVNSIVLSKFDYADVVYGTYLDQTDVTKIQRAQNACLRFALNLKRFDHISHLYPSINWLNMKDRRDLHLLILTHKTITTGNPAYLCEKLLQRSKVHNINIRTKQNLTIHKHKTTLFKRSFTYNAAKLYNSLTNELKVIQPKLFNKTLKLDMLNARWIKL